MGVFIEITSTPRAAVAPAPAPVAQTWVPSIGSAVVPAPTGLTVTPIADGAVLTWDETPKQVETMVQTSTDGSTWVTVDRTPDSTSTIGLTESSQVRVINAVEGVQSAPSAVLVATPVETATSTEVEQAKADASEALAKTADHTQQLIDQQQAIDAEIADRLAGDLAAVQAAAQDATNKANAAAAAANARADALQAQMNDFTGQADEWVMGQAYPKGDFVKSGGKLYRAIQDAPGNIPLADTGYWTKLGEYSSAGDAIAKNLEWTETLANEQGAHTQRLNGLDSKNLTQDTEISQRATNAQLDTVRTTANAAKGLADTHTSQISTLQTNQQNNTDSIAAHNNRLNEAETHINTLTGDVSGLSQTVHTNEVSFNNLKIGVTNLVKQTGGIHPAMSDCTSWLQGTLSGQCAIINGGYADWLLEIPLKPNTPYSLSFKAYQDNPVGSIRVDLFPDTLPETGFDLSNGLTEYKWENIVSSSADMSNAILRFFGFSSSAAFVISDLMLVEGTKAVSWQPNAREVKSSIDGKASSTRMDNVEQRLSNTGNGRTFESLVEQFDSTHNTVFDAQYGVTALASSMSGVRSDITYLKDTQPNLLPDFGVNTSTVTWYIAGNHNVANYADAWGRVLDLGANPSGGSSTDCWVSCWADTWYCLSVDTRRDYANGNCRVDFQFYNGGTFLGSAGGFFAAQGGFFRPHTAFQTPAGCNRVNIRFITEGTQGGDRMRRPKLELGQTPTAYDGNASVEANINSINAINLEIGGINGSVVNESSITYKLGRLLTKWTLLLNNNGVVSGVVSENDGERPTLSILGSVFRVISATTGLGMEWLDGYLRIWKGSAQLIIGHTFGANQDLIFYYGGNVGAANASKGNATIWFDTVGNAYFGGSLSAGTRKNAAQSTQQSGSASVETGNFGTGGNAKVVVCSFSAGGDTSEYGNTGAQNMPMSATVVLERRYDGGAWTQIGTFTANGQYIKSYNSGDNLTLHTAECAGSITVTDNMAGTGTFNYRARITSSSNIPVIMPNSAYQQSLSVISTEQ